ncbi:MAG: hypothetical protein GXP27_08725 [Planctomycetes bacterium]|nr:hypothetical protein [Planctomycetota bacterium]
MTAWLLRLCVLVQVTSMLFSMHASVRAAEDDPTLRREFLRGVRQVGAQLDKVTVRVKVRTSSRYTGFSKKWLQNARRRNPAAVQKAKKPRITELECAISGPRILSSALRPEGTREIRGKNERYAFAIFLPKGTNRPVVQFLERANGDGANDPRIEQHEKRLRSLVFAPYYFSEKPLHELVDQEGFTIRRVYRCDPSQPNLVRVDFDFVDQDSAGRPYATYSNSFLILDSTNNWALVEDFADIQSHFNDSHVISHRTYRLGQQSGPVAYPALVKEELTWPDDLGTKMEVVWTVRVVASDVAKEVFFLSHYGLSEPRFERRVFGIAVPSGDSTSGMWLWCFVIGVVCLVFASMLICRHLRNQR